MNTPTDMASITFKLSESLKKELEHAAHDDGRTISDYIRRFFERKLGAPAKSTPKKKGAAK